MNDISFSMRLGSLLAAPLLAVHMLASPAFAANVAGVVEHADPSKVSQPGGAGTTIVVDIEMCPAHLPVVLEGGGDIVGVIDMVIGLKARRDSPAHFRIVFAFDDAGPS